MIKWLFFLSAGVLLFSIFFHNVIEFDQDLGRHLLMGKIILETGSIPKTNLLSYTQPDFVYINSHWFSEVIFYAISQSFGIISLLYFKVAVMLAAFGLTVYTAYKYSKNLTAAAIAFAIFVPILLERTEIRPEMFSYLFIAVFMYVLLLKPKFVWFLPVLQVFWVNLHIYFILGPVLVTIFLIAKLRNNYNLAVLFFCWLANLFNPNFISGALYPLQVFNNYGYSIVENQNIFFLQNLVFNPNILFFEIAVGAFVLSLILIFRRLSFSPVILLSSLVVLPFLHIRSFPLLFLIELPVFAFVIANFRYKFLDSKLLLVAVIILTLFRSYRLVGNDYYSSIGSGKKFGSVISESGKGAAGYVLANKLHGPMFNNFDIGSYLDYRFYPGEKVFVDGRPEAYPVAFFQNLYIPMQVTPDNFRQVDDIYHFNLIIFSITDATPWGRTFLENIVRNDKFEMVYLDNYAVVLVRKGAYPPLVKNITSPKNSNISLYSHSLILF